MMFAWGMVSRRYRTGHGEVNGEGDSRKEARWKHHIVHSEPIASTITGFCAASRCNWVKAVINHRTTALRIVASLTAKASVTHHHTGTLWQKHDNCNKHQRGVQGKTDRTANGSDGFLASPRRAYRDDRQIAPALALARRPPAIAETRRLAGALHCVGLLVAAFGLQRRRVSVLCRALFIRTRNKLRLGPRKRMRGCCHVVRGLRNWPWCHDQ